MNQYNNPTFEVTIKETARHPAETSVSRNIPGYLLINVNSRSVAHLSFYIGFGGQLYINGFVRDFACEPDNLIQWAAVLIGWQDYVERLIGEAAIKYDSEIEDQDGH